MEQALSFGEVLEAADHLSADEQESLLEILHRRFVERRRGEIARDVQEAQEALEERKCRLATPDEIFVEITS